MKKILALIIIGTFLMSCAPTTYKPLSPEPLSFEQTPPYSIQENLDKIPKPEPLNPMYVKKIDEKTFEIVETREEATHIMLSPKEYAKVGALVKLAKTYKRVILDQEDLMNIQIKKENLLKEFASLERKKFISAWELQVMYRNAYQMEAYEHKVDNIIHKTSLGGMAIGSLLLLFLLL